MLRPTGQLNPAIQSVAPLPADLEPAEEGPSLDDVMKALRAADAAGNVEDAKRLAAIARSLPPPRPSISDQVRAFGSGALPPALEGLGTIGGAAAGAMLGGPPGGVLGAGAGYLLGKLGSNAAENIPGPITGKPLSPPIEDVPESERPAYRAGEVFGGGAAAVTAPFTAGSARLAQTGIITKGINKILDTAALAPGIFATSEAGGVAAASAAGGAAEYIAPDDTLLRAGAEIVAGAALPLRKIPQLAVHALDAFRAVRGAISTAARMDRAAAAVTKIIERFGEDPKRLKEKIRDLPDLPGTVGQLTGSRAIQALENTLKQSYAEFGNDAKKAGNEATLVLNRSIAGLRLTGNPAALKEAARIRDDYFRALLENRVRRAEQSAERARGPLSGVAPGSRTAASQAQRSAVDTAMRQGRQVERELWAAVDRDLPADPSAIMSRYAELREQMLPEERMPAVVEGFIARKTPQATAAAAHKTTSGELMLFRSRMLELAREAADKSEWRDARVFGELAEAALDDLDTVLSGTAYDDARAFSRAFHDTFTRTFAGAALDTGPQGRARIPPELLAARAFAGAREGGALRGRQLREAARFLPDLGVGPPEAAQNFDNMMKAQEDFLRAAATETIDPLTGRVSSARLAKFRRDHAETLLEFPALSKELGTAERAEATLQNVTRQSEQAQRAIDKKAIFGRLVNTEDPSRTVGEAIASNRPMEGLRQLANLAKKHGADAVDGLASSVLDYAYKRAGGGTDTFSFTKYREALYRPLRTGAPSLAAAMRNHGVLTSEQLGRLRQLMQRGETVEKALRNRDTVDMILSPTDAITDFAIRVIGADIGARSATGHLGHGLVAAQAGSRMLRRLLDRIPAARTQTLLIEAAKNPELFAMLLERPVTAGAQFRLGAQMHAYLLNAGLIEPLRGSGREPDSPTTAGGVPQ